MIKQAPKLAISSIYLKFEKIYFLIAAISVILVLWQYLGMNRIAEIYPSTAKVTVTSDSLNGGSSEASLNITDEGAQLDCQIKPSSTFAYCNLDISIGDGINKEGAFRSLPRGAENANLKQILLQRFVRLKKCKIHRIQTSRCFQHV